MEAGVLGDESATDGGLGMSEGQAHSLQSAPHPPTRFIAPCTQDPPVHRAACQSISDGAFNTCRRCADSSAAQAPRRANREDGCKGHFWEAQIWGPGDNHLLPRIIDRARAGRLRFVGTVRKKIDVVYVDNAARAHLDALDRLAPGAACAGRAYFISNGEPVTKVTP